MDYSDYEDDMDDYYDDDDYPPQRPQQVVKKQQPKQTEIKTKKPVKLEKKTRKQVQNQEKSFKQAPLSEFQMDQELADLCSLDCNKTELESLHLVVLGHVDAGKSTLMGRLLHDLGIVSQKEMHKHQKEANQAGKPSFSWAYVLDERPEERERGITVDVATARFKTKKFNITLLDAPGHKDFIPNMISGTAQADAALLIVDGSIGGFESGYEMSEGSLYCGQTREHVQLAKGLGVQQMAVIVTKLDTCDFSKNRYEFIKTQMEPFLEKCGFQKTILQWLMACAPLGINIISPPSQLNESLLSWYTGPTVIDAIDAFQPITRTIHMPLRIPVNEVIKTRTLGSGINGKIESGAVRIGSKIWIPPTNERGIVEALEIGGKSVKFAKAGDCCDVGLGQIDHSMLFPGCVICPEGWPTPITQRFECKILVLDIPIPILPGLQVSFQCHSVRESGKISRLISLINPKNSEVVKEKPRCLRKGDTAIIELESSRSICVEEYSSFKALGRISIRESGRTLAIGIVTTILHES